MPARKRPDSRQGRATADLQLAPAPASSEVPPAPLPGRRKMLQVSRESWAAFWASELASLVLPADRSALVRLWSLYDMRERMLRAAVVAPFVEGSTGQMTTHPALKEVGSLDGRITALEDRFGITPKGRLALGITMGAAAKSLAEMNRQFSAGSTADGGGPDPRRAAAVDVSPA